MADSRRTGRQSHVTHRVHPRQLTCHAPHHLSDQHRGPCPPADNTRHPCERTSRAWTPTASRCTGRAPSPTRPPHGARVTARWWVTAESGRLWVAARWADPFSTLPSTVIARRVRLCPRRPRAGSRGRRRPPGSRASPKTVASIQPIMVREVTAPLKSSTPARRQQVRSANGAHLSLLQQSPQSLQSPNRHLALTGCSPGVQLPPAGQYGVFTPIAHQGAAG